ncbi:hypothetical protein EGR_10572 [Echinococcus granulosus]|uniref:Uncharacterized protein n=1 Tax=Echinococcus granulosus TaxID=6210 RepID=W6U860_ECHGR|nr:hypothetical protein EGR_10572 [Echinococcus granulosus]EUB54572.1 hypothetical protein EGR_10572 [Echinococcus granulosus]
MRADYLTVSTLMSKRAFFVFQGRWCAFLIGFDSFHLSSISLVDSLPAAFRCSQLWRLWLYFLFNVGITRLCVCLTRKQKEEHKNSQFSHYFDVDVRETLIYEYLLHKGVTILGCDYPLFMVKMAANAEIQMAVCIHTKGFGVISLENCRIGESERVPQCLHLWFTTGYNEFWPSPASKGEQLLIGVKLHRGVDLHDPEVHMMLTLVRVINSILEYIPCAANHLSVDPPLNMKASPTVSSITKVTSWTDMLEEESLCVCSCEVDVNNFSSFTTSSSSPSSDSSGGSSEVTDMEECTLSSAPAPLLRHTSVNINTGTQRVKEPYKVATPPEEFKQFMSSGIVPEEWFRKSRRIANTGRVRTQLAEVIKKLDMSIGRLREASAINALTPVKVTGRGPIEVEVELYPLKGNDHRSTHEGDAPEKLNRSHSKLPSKVVDSPRDAISEVLFLADEINCPTSERKHDKIRNQKAISAKHSPVKKYDPLTPKWEDLEGGKVECHQGDKKPIRSLKPHKMHEEKQSFGMTVSSNRMKCVEELCEESPCPFQRSGGLSTNACENHVPNPTSTHATELARDYEIVVRKSSHERKRYFVCLMDEIQERNLKGCVETPCFEDAMKEELPIEKRRANSKSILDRNRELLNLHRNSIEVEKNCEGNTLGKTNAIHQKGSFADMVATCIGNCIEEMSQTNREFVQISQSIDPPHGELRFNSSSETSFDSFEVITVLQTSDDVSRYPNNVVKKLHFCKPKDTTKGQLKEPSCTLIEISDDSVAFLPELPIENTRVLPPDLKYVLGGRAKIQTGESCATDALKVYENPTQIPEYIIRDENNDAADVRGWYPSLYSIPNMEKHLVEACAEFSHDLCGIQVKVTEPQGADVVTQTHLVNVIEPNKCLRVLQPFWNVTDKSFKSFVDSSEHEMYRRCAMETQISPSSNELSWLLQDGDTVREGAIELSLEKHYQNTATTSNLTDTRQFASKNSKNSQKGPEFPFHCTSHDSDGFGDVEEGLRENEKCFTKSYQICHVLGTSSSVDGGQTQANDNDKSGDFNAAQLEYTGKIRLVNSTLGYMVTPPDRPRENVEILEKALEKIERLKALEVKRCITLPTALTVSRNLNRVCQKVLAIEEEVMETVDRWDKTLQRTSKIALLPLVNIHPKPEIRTNQITTTFANETVDNLYFLNSTALVMPQNTFQKEEKSIGNKPQTVFPESVCIIPLQGTPGFFNNYKPFHCSQENPRNLSKIEDIISSPFISTNTRDGLTEGTESEETNPVVVDDPPAQNAAETLKHLDSLENYYFALEHLNAAKKSVQRPNCEGSDFLLCWSSAPPISRLNGYHFNSTKIPLRNHSKHLFLPHGKHVMSRLKESRPFPCGTFKNPSGGGGGASICGERVRPIVLMSGFKLDADSKYPEQTHNTFYIKEKDRSNNSKRETVPTSQWTEKGTVRIKTLSTKQEPKIRRDCRNPLDLLILDTISSISEHNAMDSNGNESFDMRLLFERRRCKRSTSVWWKKYRSNN